MKLLKTLSAAAVVVTAAAAPLSAQTIFDFANLKNPATVTNLTPDNGTICTGGDRCSAYGGVLSFSQGIFSVDASGFYNDTHTMAVQDHDNGYNGTGIGNGTVGAGLGVYHQFNASNQPSNTSDDNITSGETLKLSFNQIVTLNSVGMRSEGHNFTNWTSGAMFEWSTDGSSWVAAALPQNVGKFDLNATSQDFYFRYAENTGDQFYISAAFVSEPDRFEVPEPASLALLGLGMFSMGLVARRKRGTTV